MSAALQSILNTAAKLKTLSERAGTPEEAAVAASKLQALLLRHNLDLSEVRYQEEDQFQNQPYTIPVKGDHAPWMQVLYSLLARNHQCMSIHWQGTQRVAIVGRPHNIQVVQYLFEYLSKTLQQLANKGARSYTGPGSRGSFIRAFGLGACAIINQRLKETKEAIQNESAKNNQLMVVEDQLVTQEVAKLFGKVRKSKPRRAGNADGFVEGRKAGASIPLRSGVGGSNSQQGLLT